MRKMKNPENPTIRECGESSTPEESVAQRSPDQAVTELQQPSDISASQVLPKIENVFSCAEDAEQAIDVDTLIELIAKANVPKVDEETHIVINGWKLRIFPADEVVKKADEELQQSPGVYVLQDFPKIESGISDAEDAEQIPDADELLELISNGYVPSVSEEIKKSFNSWTLRVFSPDEDAIRNEEDAQPIPDADTLMELLSNGNWPTVRDENQKFLNGWKLSVYSPDEVIIRGGEDGQQIIDVDALLELNFNGNVRRFGEETNADQTKRRRNLKRKSSDEDLDHAVKRQFTSSLL